jgi:hypothetical protein
MAKPPPFDLRKFAECLRYEPETGHLYWIVRNSNFIDMAMPAGCPMKNGYRKVMVGNKQLYAHHIAWWFIHGEWPQQQVDHINGNRLDNRASNLRLATQEQQNFNGKLFKNNKCGVKGVCLNKRNGKWRAHIVVQKKQLRLGEFRSIEEARVARLRAEALHCGEYARPTPQA